MKLVRAGEFYFFACTCMYMTICVHTMLNFFYRISGNFYSIFFTNRYAVFPVQFFYISANDVPDLFIRESYKLGFV